MKAQLDVIKSLMLEYACEKDKVIFSKLLKRTDNLLLHIIHKLLRAKPHLRSVDIQELYHTSIIGLSKASLSIKESEELRYVPARIVAYVKAEIRISYPYRPIKKLLRNRDLDLPTFQDDSEKMDSLLDLQEAFQELSFEDMKLLFGRYYREQSYKDIGRDVHRAAMTVRSRLLRILDKLRKRLR